MHIADIANSAEAAEAWRAEQREEAAEMSRIMKREEGLLNMAQAAVFLGVTRQRVAELMKLRILERYEFLGHVYVSFRQVDERRAEDVKAGRPRRKFLKRLGIALNVLAHSDLEQMKRGGPAPETEPIIAKKKRAGK